MSSSKSENKAIAKRLARFFAENGFNCQKRLVNKNVNDARINFLRSPEDPLHEYYKQKLSQYLSQIENIGAIVDDSDDDEEEASSQQVIEPPPGTIRNDIEWTARYISKRGLESEKMMMRSHLDTARYSFMGRSDPFHAFYKHKLAEYLSQNQPNNDQDDDEPSIHEDIDPVAHRHFLHPQPIILPGGLDVRLPKGMNQNEFNTMKLTAQFGAWYGNDFWLGFKKRAGFEFTIPTDCRFPRFTRFVLEYSEVMNPPKGLKEEVTKNDAYMAAIHDGFFRLLDCGFPRETEWRLGGVISMIEWHASLAKDFPPGTGTGTETETETEMSHLGPGLVPEDQFLAQHPGWCTIRVFVGDSDDLDIEVTVQSLMENVLTLKEKIFEEIQFPPETQVLFGKAGLLLKDNHRSLAHYNVGAGEYLTLSMCACGRQTDADKPCPCIEMLSKAHKDRVTAFMLSSQHLFD